MKRFFLAAFFCCFALSPDIAMAGGMGKGHGSKAELPNTRACLGLEPVCLTGGSLFYKQAGSKSRKVLIDLGVVAFVLKCSTKYDIC